MADPVEDATELKAILSDVVSQVKTRAPGIYDEAVAEARVQTQS